MTLKNVSLLLCTRGRKGGGVFPHCSFLLPQSQNIGPSVRCSSFATSTKSFWREEGREGGLVNIKSLRTLERLALNHFNFVPVLGGLRSQGRQFHSGKGEGEDQTHLNRRLPPLNNFPALLWPKFTNSIRNWFFTYFVIKPYFDKEFSMQEFMAGAHEAVALVSTKLSAGEFDDLEGLVDPLLLNELRQKLSSFSVSQQDLLRVATEDIFFSFPYQVGVIIPDAPPGQSKYIESGQKPPPQTRYVEITVVLHVLRGMAEIQRNSKDSSSFSVVDFTKDEENKYRVMVCNYRFFRDFTEGCANPQWIINLVNHFLPAEIQR